MEQSHALFQQKQSAHPLESADQVLSRLSNFLNALPVAAAFASQEGKRVKIIAHNEPFAKKGLVGSGRSLLEPPFLLSLIARADAASNRQATAQWASRDVIHRRELEITASFCSLHDIENEQILLTIMDRTSEIETREQWRREMVFDALTGLANRTGFEEQVDAIMETAHDSSDKTFKPTQFAIFSVDMARFSQINECAGGVVGDELISTVARRLIGKIRRRDILGRIGSNQFGIYAQVQKGEKEVLRFAERIQDAFTDPFCLSDMEIQIDAAIGVAIGQVGQRSASDYVRDSQVALKKAKISKQLEIYSPDALDTARRRFTLETELRKALQNNQLELHFQPLIDFTNGGVVGFEALARWNDPVRGFIRPSEFVPVAEECGLVVQLGRWALEEACETLKRWDVQTGETLPIKINVNVSAVQFARDDIPKMVAQTLKASKISSQRIVLELTESVIVSDPKRAAQVMQALRDLNVSLAMDDFGTGYSNLASLQQLPIDVLKIDRSFVTNMLEDKDKVAIVRAILSLATALGMETTAEGIESLELYNTLAALGCTYGQGYYMAAPLPAKEALALFLNQRKHGTFSAA